jgi:hypothetical protein
MGEELSLGFERDCHLVPLDEILPLRSLPKGLKETTNFGRIKASIMEVGIVEPLVVTRFKGKQKSFLLLDGHVRLEILKRVGTIAALCLIATSDEAFTYNKRISQLATVQQNRMILRAIERGVDEERLSKALNINIKTLRIKMNMLNGICPEVVELLRDRTVSMRAFSVLKKMKPIRQIEVAELMNSLENHTSGYADALLLATPEEQLVNPNQSKTPRGVLPEQLDAMSVDLNNLQREYKANEGSYGANVLKLVLAQGYIMSLIENDNIAQFLGANHPEFLTEFRRITHDRNLVQMPLSGALSS